MPEDPTRFQAEMRQVEEELRRWRVAHPDATLTEIEAALDTRLREARTGLLAELATDRPDAEDRCPACGGLLVRRGNRHRMLVTQGDQLLPLTRSYASCPACGAGLSPPR